MSDVFTSAGESVKQAASSLWRKLAVPSPRARPLAGVGAALVAVASFLPWTTFFGYAGDLDLGGKPEGARTYTLAAALAAGSLAIVAWKGRRRAGLSLGVALLVVALGNVAAVFSAGRRTGLDSFGFDHDRGVPGIGLWMVVAGAVLLILGFASMGEQSDDRSLMGSRALPETAQLIVIVVAFAAVLALIVHGLSVEESSRFLSFFALAMAGAAALGRLDVMSAISAYTEKHRKVTIAAAALAAAVFPFTQGSNAYWVRVMASVLVFACAAIGLNIVVGLAGLLDLGYVAFFGVGAYTAGILGNAGLTYYKVHIPFVFVFIIAACVAAAFGLLIGAPTLRLEGDYLAIVTLGFGEIFRIAANNDFLRLTRGPNGVSQIPNLDLVGVEFGKDNRVLGKTLPYFANYYFLELLVLAGVIVAFSRLNTSRIGRAWVAIREDELAAQAMGVNTIAMKLLAFSIGAFLAGAAGTVNAHLATQVSPDSYTFFESILLLAAVVLGGMGSVTGAIIGSTALFVIPEKLRFFQDKRLLLFGIALVVMMRLRPAGIVPNRRARLQKKDSQAHGGAS